MLIPAEVTNPRAQVTERIGYAPKIKHPGSGGVVNGQSRVMLLLVTEQVAIPVAVRFYQPTQSLSAGGGRMSVGTVSAYPSANGPSLRR